MALFMVKSFENLIKAYTSIIKDHNQLEILTLFFGEYYNSRIPLHIIE